jgi:hypothetical protein
MDRLLGYRCTTFRQWWMRSLVSDCSGVPVHSSWWQERRAGLRTQGSQMLVNASQPVAAAAAMSERDVTITLTEGRIESIAGDNLTHYGK